MTLIILDRATDEPLDPQPELDDGMWVTDGKSKFEYQAPVTVTPITVYDVLNLTITVADSAATTTYTGDYDAAISADIVISGNLENGTSIDYGDAKLKLPVIRFAGDKMTDDEIYFDATVKAGVLSAQGSFPRSGKWRFDIKRINESIDGAGNGWHLGLTNKDYIDFLVSV